MPRVASGTKDEFRGETGKFQVVPDRLADEVLAASEWRPEALRAIFKVHTTDRKLKGKEVSWAIPIEEPDLRPFTSKIPKGEAALRREIEGMLDTTPRWANVYNSFIQRWLAPVGKHIGRLDNLRLTKRDDGSHRVWIRLITNEGLTSEFPCPWPNIECRVGETPDEDWMGPEDQLNEGKGPFPYLTTLGLNWERWTTQDLENAPALFDGHYDNDLVPITPYFRDIDDLTPDLVRATHEHGLATVQWEVIMHERYGLSVKRGQFFFELTPVIVEGSPEDKAFQDEKEIFLELWDNLTKVILQKDDARFVAGTGKPTKESRAVVKGVLVPLVRQYPDLVKVERDGKAIASFPINREGWRTNGLAVLGFFAERLMKEGDLFEIVNLSDPKTLLEWAAENVPELADDMTVDEGEEY